MTTLILVFPIAVSLTSSAGARFRGIADDVAMPAKRATEDRRRNLMAALAAVWIVDVEV
jgi:hypothetical protein